MFFPTLTLLPVDFSPHQRVGLGFFPAVFNEISLDTLWQFHTLRTGFPITQGVCFLVEIIQEKNKKWAHHFRQVQVPQPRPVVHGGPPSCWIPR